MKNILIVAVALCAGIVRAGTQPVYLTDSAGRPNGASNPIITSNSGTGTSNYVRANQGDGQDGPLVPWPVTIALSRTGSGVFAGLATHANADPTVVVGFKDTANVVRTPHTVQYGANTQNFNANALITESALMGNVNAVRGTGVTAMMISATPFSDGSAGLYVLTPILVNGSSAYSNPSGSVYHDGSGIVRGVAPYVIPTTSVGSMSTTKIVVSVANGATILLSSDVVGFRLAMSTEDTTGTLYVWAAFNDQVQVPAVTIAQAFNKIGRTITHMSSNVTAVAGAVYDGPWVMENLKIGSQGATIWLAPSVGNSTTVLVDVWKRG